MGDADIVQAALVGAYDGSGTGTLSTLSTTAGGAPTSADANVTVSVDIDTALPVVPSTTGDATDLPLRLMTVTGTVTLTVGDADPVSYAVTGTLQLAGGTADVPRGRLVLTATPTGTAAGFTLSGVLVGDTIGVSWLVASDHSAAPGGYVFQYRAARGTNPLTLTQA